LKKRTDAIESHNAAARFSSRKRGSKQKTIRTKLILTRYFAVKLDETVCL
jgi:hypothetical protein